MNIVLLIYDLNTTFTELVCFAPTGITNLWGGGITCRNNDDPWVSKY